MLYGLLSLFTLLTGIIIYLLFRDLDNIILYSWIPKPPSLKAVLVPLKPTIFSCFLKYHLPDVLWILSVILFFRFFWFYNIKLQKNYVYSTYGIGFILEASQLVKNIPGTFDWFDLFFMGIGAFVEGLLYNIFSRRRLHE